MNGLGNTGEPWELICQVVDKDFYPLGDVFPFRASPKTYVAFLAKDIRWSERMTISNLGLIDDPNNIDSLGATLWKLSNPYHITDEGRRRRVAVEKLLETVRREQQSLVEELDTPLRISRYFDDESLPDGHLHLLLRISGVGGANPF